MNKILKRIFIILSVLLALLLIVMLSFRISFLLSLSDYEKSIRSAFSKLSSDNEIFNYYYSYGFFDTMHSFVIYDSTSDDIKNIRNVIDARNIKLPKIQDNNIIIKGLDLLIFTVERDSNDMYKLNKDLFESLQAQDDFIFVPEHESEKGYRYYQKEENITLSGYLLFPRINKIAYIQVDVYNE